MTLAFAARFGYPVTPSDTLALPRFGYIICKGVAGNVVFTAEDGVSQTFPIGIGETLPVICTSVKATGTTATALWCYAY